MNTSTVWFKQLGIIGRTMGYALVVYAVAASTGAGARSTVNADLVAFTRAKGLYGGVNLDGTVVNASAAWNEIFYGRPNVLPTDILIRKTATNSEAVPLLTDLDAATR